MHALGIDIGGTGMKAAPVDLETGKFLADRVKIATPHPAVPDAVAEVVQKLVAAFSWSGPIGCTFPGVVMNGVTRTAANLDKAWIGLDARELLCQGGRAGVRLINDADAAGVAEMTFGAGKGQRGTVHMVTLGTGIGSALFVDGILVPNTEFGHLEIRGKDSEERASERAKVAGNMSWKHWAKNVNEYLEHIEALLSPALIIIGGGISKQSDKFLPADDRIAGQGGTGRDVQRRGHHRRGDGSPPGLGRPGASGCGRQRDHRRGGQPGGAGRQRHQRRPGTAGVPGPGPAAGLAGVSGRGGRRRAGRP